MALRRTTFKSFADFAHSWNEEVVRAVDSAIRKVTQEVCLAIVQEVISITPVDTGKARANWLASLGSPRGSTRETLGRSPAPAIGEAKAVISFYRNGSDFYLVNNLDYVADLNSGRKATRQQSPGFVERAFASGVERGIQAAITKFSV